MTLFNDKPPSSGEARKEGLARGWRARSSFVAANRHSARVQFFRYAIVIACLSIFAFLAFSAYLDPFRKLTGKLTVESVAVEGEKVTLHSPRLTGVRSDGQPYEVLSRTVVQDTSRPKIFNLEDVTARLGSADGSTIRIQSAKGVYDSGNDMIELQEKAQIMNPGRYTLDLKSATINMKLGDFVSHEPVVGRLSNGFVTSKEMSYIQSEQRIIFSRDAHSEFREDAVDVEMKNAASAEPIRQDTKSE